MVYESDFYTTRRPYSSYSSRPYVSSYSVTPIRGPYYLWLPYYPFLRTAPHLPYVAHRRLVSITHTPMRIYRSSPSYPLVKIHSRIRPSILAAELNRIRYLMRPTYKSYLEDYLQSRDYIDFDDETRAIRAKTDNLLKKVHVYVPRPSVSDYEETSPERLRSDDYVRRIINSKNSRKDIESLPWYSTPEKHTIGSGNLACIKYAGGRPQPRRRPYYTVGDLVPGDVKSDVNLMSFYRKNRKAAEDALKKEPDDDTIKKVQDYLAKKAEEKRMEEERRAWEAAERRRIAEEKQLALLASIKLEEDLRIAEIKEQERLEAERQATIAKAEAARHEAERIVADEKLYNEAVAQAIADEEERQAREKEREEREKQDEDEDKMATLVLSATNGVDDDSALGEAHTEDHGVHADDLTNPDNEVRPYEVDRDEDTQIEEDGLHEDQEDIVSPFVDAGSAVSSEQAAEEPIVEEADSPQIAVQRKPGGEQGFDWSEYEEADETAEESRTAQAEEPRQFDENEIESRSNDEAHIAESEVVEARDEDETDDAEARGGNDEETIQVFQVADESETQEAPEEEHQTQEVDDKDEVKSEKSCEEEFDREQQQEE